MSSVFTHTRSNSRCGALVQVLTDEAQQQRHVHHRQLARDEADVGGRDALVDLLDKRFLVEAECHHERLEVLLLPEDLQDRLRRQVHAKIEGVEGDTLVQRIDEQAFCGCRCPRASGG